MTTQRPIACSANSKIALATGRRETDYGLGDNHGSKLPHYPLALYGDRTPLDLYRYAGRGQNSWGSPNLRMPWDEWVEFHRVQKPQLMADVHAYMNSRFDFSGKAIEGIAMTGGKPIMQGPVARLPAGVDTWEDLAAMRPIEIKEADIFPYVPLAHPLQWNCN